jgi:2-polyprenyl-3-methyl-5-hydroxy-6-metoxy-1,4-benzoquinol methylase
MGVGTLTCADLDQYVAECDRLGGPEHLAAKDFLSDFDLRISTPVDQRLDPFSEEYVAQQIAVYREVANRNVDQETGEQAPVPVEQNILSPNPYASRDVHFISKHSRAVVTTVLVSNLPPAARVLDVGCGWGLSSEVMAFCGLDVDGIDINPLFVDLVGRRAQLRKLPITPILSQFDNIRSSYKYDLALFYESLHHAIRPWNTIAGIAPLLKEDGKIAFAGEPINDIWWRNWGVRLDSLSVYCIRKFGWFESGWSRRFITSCFEHAGFALETYEGIGLDNGIIGVAVRKDALSSSMFARPRPDYAAPPPPPALPPPPAIAIIPTPPAPPRVEAPQRRRKKKKSLARRILKRVRKVLSTGT